ncbi:hypothetical protein GGU11DRAFT_69604 [Lentinula aff. detonsa]|nr:hypothetical protein GGU11DRAFT_69604 [Lentinula aff. detonsa]
MGSTGEKYFGGDIKAKSNAAKTKVEAMVDKPKDQENQVEEEKEEGELKEEEGELDQDSRPEIQFAKSAPVIVEVEEVEVEVPDGGPEDDGRSLLSAGWGVGHDGSGIEVIDAEFIPVNSFPDFMLLLLMLVSTAARRLATFWPS